MDNTDFKTLTPDHKRKIMVIIQRDHKDGDGKLKDSGYYKNICDFLKKSWLKLLESGFYDEINATNIEKGIQEFYNPFAVLYDLYVVLGYGDWIYTSKPIVEWQKTNSGNYTPIYDELTEKSSYFRAKNPDYFWLHPDYIMKPSKDLEYNTKMMREIREYMDNDIFKSLNISLKEAGNTLKLWFE